MNFNFESSPIRQFLHSKTVFLTGGFGFVGKLLIEKLLKCEVRRIYLLARSKKGKSMQERLDDFIQDPAFTNIREQSAAAFSRIYLINGDLQQLRLGIADENYSLLLEEVEIVFHAGADVRFDESLRETIETNLRGTREMLVLGKAMKKLNVFVYVSTCFVAVNTEVDEKVYETVFDPDMLIKFVEQLHPGDYERFESMAANMIRPFPNNYTFSKALAEQITMKFASDMNIAIVRPSIIGTAYHEPLPGYTDNVYGVNGVVFGGGFGVLRIMHIDNSLKGSMIPADYVINCILAVAWYTFYENNFKFNLMSYENVNAPEIVQEEDESETRKIKIYHITSAFENSITWGDVKTICMPIGEQIPIPGSVWIITYNTTRYFFVAYVLRILYHWIPAYVMDRILVMRNKKPRLLKIYRKVTYFSEVLYFFLFNEWHFKTSNLYEMIESMSESDRKEFFTDPKDINWDDYMVKFCYGLRKFVAKQSEDSIPLGRKVYRQRKIIHNILMTIIYTLMALIFYRVLKFYGFNDYLAAKIDDYRLSDLYLYTE